MRSISMSKLKTSSRSRGCFKFFYSRMGIPGRREQHRYRSPQDRPILYANISTSCSPDVWQKPIPGWTDPQSFQCTHLETLQWSSASKAKENSILVQCAQDIRRHHSGFSPKDSFNQHNASWRSWPKPAPQFQRQRQWPRQPQQPPDPPAALEQPRSARDGAFATMGKGRLRSFASLKRQEPMAWSPSWKW